MNKRERTLIILTVVVVAAVLAFNFLLPAPEESAAVAGGAGELTQVREEFESYQKILADKDRIEEEYRRIDFSQTQPRPGQSADQHFSDELYALLTERFGIINPPPNIGRPKMQMITGVEDYYFVEIPLEVSGTLQDMLRLLVNMDQNGVLIKNFSLAQRGAQRGEGSVVTLDVEVARLVKHDEQSRQRIRRVGAR